MLSVSQLSRDELELAINDSLNYFLPPFVSTFLKSRRVLKEETNKDAVRVSQRRSTVTPVLFDGEEFCIHESMMERPLNFWSLENAPLKGVLLLCFWPLVFTVMFSFTILVLIYGKAASKKIASYMVPIICTGIDHKLCNIRKELLKNMHGNVLDFGSGSGVYTKYAFESQREVKKYVSLEINTNIHPRLRQAHAACRKAYEDRQKAPFPQSRDSGISLSSSTNSGKKESDERREFGFPPPAFEIQTQFLGQLRDNNVFPEAHFDWILCGNVLCQVENVEEELRLLDYFLKPGGRVYYSEHVQSRKHSWRYVLQQVVNPWWSRVFNGCNCNRATTESIKSATPWTVRNWTFFFGILPWIDQLATGLCVKPKV